VASLGSGDFTVRLWDTVPLKARYQARRQAEALRPEAEHLVELLSAGKKNATEVAAAVDANRSRSEPRKDAALSARLRRSAMRREEGQGRARNPAPNQ
jgi:hypothetical protein